MPDQPPKRTRRPLTAEQETSLAAVVRRSTAEDTARDRKNRQIARAIDEDGVPVAAIARAIGTHRSQVYAWLELGRTSLAADASEAPPAVPADD